MHPSPSTTATLCISYIAGCEALAAPLSPERGLITRPSALDVLGYRAYVDAGMERPLRSISPSLERD